MQKYQFPLPPSLPGKNQFNNGYIGGVNMSWINLPYIKRLKKMRKNVTFDLPNLF